MLFGKKENKRYLTARDVLEHVSPESVFILKTACNDVYVGNLQVKENTPPVDVHSAGEENVSSIVLHTQVHRQTLLRRTETRSYKEYPIGKRFTGPFQIEMGFQNHQSFLHAEITDLTPDYIDITTQGGERLIITSRQSDRDRVLEMIKP